MITIAQLDKVDGLTQRIHRVRSLLGDLESPPSMITRPRYYNRASFKKRIKSLRALELQRHNLAMSLANQDHVTSA